MGNRLSRSKHSRRQVPHQEASGSEERRTASHGLAHGQLKGKHRRRQVPDQEASGSEERRTASHGLAHGQLKVPTDSPIRKLLDDPDIRPDLLHKIEINAMFVAHLAPHLGLNDKEYLKNPINLNSDKVDRLLNVVSSNKLQDYLAFRKALQKTKQNGVLEILDDGENGHNFINHQPAKKSFMQKINVSIFLK